MTNKQFKLKRKQLREDLREAKYLEERERKAYLKCQRAAGAAFLCLIRQEADRIRVEDRLRNLEWKHGLNESPECTGTEY